MSIEPSEGTTPPYIPPSARPADPRAAAGRSEELPPGLRMAARSIYGGDVAGYAAGRPDYPHQVYETLQRRCGLATGSEVLEVGAGTGLVTRRLIDSSAQAITALRMIDQSFGVAARV
jgi:hypothetical protein